MCRQCNIDIRVPSERPYSAKEVANLLEIEISEVYDMVESGDLEAIKYKDYLVFDDEVIKEYLSLIDNITRLWEKK